MSDTPPFDSFLKWKLGIYLSSAFVKGNFRHLLMFDFSGMRRRSKVKCSLCCFRDISRWLTSISSHVIIIAGGAGYKQPKILLVTLLSSLSRWSCCYQFLITWRKNKNCYQRYLTKIVKTGTCKFPGNILKN